MQNIIEHILKTSSIKRDIGVVTLLLTELFEVNSLIPKEIENKRPSLIAFKNCKNWGGSVENSLASAFLTLNSDHGPFGKAYNVINKSFEDSFDNFDKWIKLRLQNNEKIEGFGNPVIKSLDVRCERIKKVFKNCDEESFTDYMDLGNEVSVSIFRKCGKEIEPNIVFWNAAIIHYLGLPETHASLIFLLAIQIKYVNLLWHH